MNNPLVTIIIPVYNGTNFLKEALDSALSQTYQNIEILVVNDGSTDDKTEQIAIEYGDKIRYYYKENGGVASALNYGIQRMNGEYFSWLSHDDLYYPTKIEKQIKAINKNINKSRIVYSAYDILYEESGAKESVFLEERYKKERLENSVFSLLFGLMNGCSLLIHKSHFERVGTFNEALLTTQDYDLWFRMFRGQKLIYINESLVISRRHSQQGSRTIQVYNSERENLYRNIIENLSNDEIRKLYRSEYNFYFKMTTFFESRGLYEVYKYTYNKLINIENNVMKSKDWRKVFNQLIEYPSRKISKICLFGMGDYGKQLFEELVCRMIPIHLFIDNDGRKWGKEHKGVICISVDELKKCKEDVLIIVAIITPKLIVNQLKENGFANVITLQSIEQILLETDPVEWLVKQRKEINSVNEYRLINNYNNEIFEMIR